MTTNRSGLSWGMLLIGAGMLALAQQLGYIARFTGQVWVWGFGLIAVLGFVSYAFSGWKQWSWLFPAGIFGGLAATIALGMANVNSAEAASPLFLGILIPFLVAYLTDRVHNWWALIPGGMMLFLLVTTLFAGQVGGAWIGSLFLFMIAAGFLIVYWNNRSQTWALLVGYIIAVLGLAPAMASNSMAAPYFGAIFLFGIAVPFFIVYLRSVDKWWAIIPAGVMTVLAIITFAGIAGWLRNENASAYVSAFLLAGLAATFALNWLRDAKPWAKIVTMVLAALALACLLFAARSAILWPLAIILVGAYLLFVSTRTKTL